MKTKEEILQKAYELAKEYCEGMDPNDSYTSEQSFICGYTAALTSKEKEGKEENDPYNELFKEWFNEAFKKK